MRYFLIIIFILIILFLQVGILPHLAILGAFPNLIVLAILSLSILQGWKKTLPWIIAGGLFLDFYSLRDILGVSIAALLIASYLAYFLSQNIFKQANAWSLLLIFLITIFVYNLILLINSDFRFLSFASALIYNLILALPNFYGVKKIQS